MTDADIKQLLNGLASGAVCHPIGRAGLEVAEKLVVEIRRLRNEMAEAHAHLTGKGEVAWRLTHDAAETELGKAAAALNEKVARLGAELQRLPPATLYVVSEHHRAEGSRVVGVYDHEPTGEELAACAGTSSYEQSERDKWCSIVVEKYDVNRPCSFAERHLSSP